MRGPFPVRDLLIQSRDPAFLVIIGGRNGQLRHGSIQGALVPDVDFGFLLINGRLRFAIQRVIQVDGLMDGQGVVARLRPLCDVERALSIPVRRHHTKSVGVVAEHGLLVVIVRLLACCEPLELVFAAEENVEHATHQDT